MDHTYKINKRRMPVTVFMTMDCHGNGRSAGYAFIANEKTVTVKHVMEAFVESVGPKITEKICTVVIDKDYTEVKVITEVIPHVSIQLCDFHVARTLTKKCLQGRS